MKLPRRNFLHLAAGAAALPVVSRLARAQDYPTRPVRLIVGWPPGGGADTVSRIVGQWLSERLGQQVIIENRPGASTNISAQAVINSPPDGYTLLFYSASTLINTIMFHNLPFDVRRDIAPVSGLVAYPMVLVAHPSVPAKTVTELIAHAKANPGKVTMAVVWNRVSLALGRRAIQHDGRDQLSPCPLSRRRAHGDRSDRRTSAGWVRCDGDIAAANTHRCAAGAWRSWQQSI